MRPITAILLIASALIALNAGVVYAEPDNKNSYEVEMNCPEIGETFTLVIVSPDSSARHIQGTTDNLILKSVVGTAIIGGDTFPINFSLPEQSLENQDPMTCYVNDTFFVPIWGVEVTVDVTVRAQLSPRGQH